MSGAATLTIALCLLTGGCDGGGGPPAPQRQRAATAALPGPVQRDPERPRTMAGSGVARPAVTVYYLRRLGTERYLAPERRPVPPALPLDKMAAAAVTELLAGSPRCPASERPFPGGTRLLDLRVTGGTADVNLSRQALGAASPDGYALQALVWTVTQLPVLKRVVVRVEGRSGGSLDGRLVGALLGVGSGGRPLVRDRSLQLAPILLAEPSALGPVAGDRVVVRGEARVAGGTVGLRLRDMSGRVVSQSFATVAVGPRGWGRFSGALLFTPPRRAQLWRVEAFEASTVDGSVTYSVAVPVRVGG